MAKPTLGIRGEDKNRWERRTPLTPDDVREIVSAGFDVVVQPSSIRVFREDEYVAAGARVSEDLGACTVVMGVKEMPEPLFRKAGVYVYFAHVAKGQPYNMPMLKALLARGASLVDYEKVVDDHGRRLIFFGRHAGLAGTIDTLWAAGRRLIAEGYETPFSDVQPAHRYRDLAEARLALGKVGSRIAAEGLPRPLVPFIVGVAGYGNVAGGAQEILEALGARDIPVSGLPSLFRESGADPRAVYRVTFKEEHTVTPVEPGAKFDLAEFFAHPERYRAKFEPYVPLLTLLLNCVYWDKRCPRLVTKAFVREFYGRPGTPRLRVIGDITCDVLGSIECNVKITTPDNPVYVWDPVKEQAIDGWKGHGPVVLAVDNLPCELPAESSASFGAALRRFVPELLKADWSVPFAELALPRELKDAVIAHRGELAPQYAYIAGLW